MAFTDVYSASQDAAFQGRCWAAAWKTADLIIKGNAPTDAVPRSLDTPDSRIFSLQLLRNQAGITGEQLAIQILTNPTIAANPTVSTDNDIDFQTVQTWLDGLVIIG